MTHPARERRALVVVLLGSMVVVALVLRPLALALFLAGVLATALWPLYHWLCRRLHGRKNVAAGILVTLLLVVVLGPLTALAVFLVRESIEAAQFVARILAESGLEGLLDRLPQPVARALRGLVEGARADTYRDLRAHLQEQLTAYSGEVAGVVGAALTATGSLLFRTAMLLIALFFFLTQKEPLLNWIDEASPLGRAQTQELGREFRRVTGAVLRSSILTALVQALVAVVGYYIVSLPSPVFFGALTFVVALIPAVGATAVCLFAAGLLLLAGHPVSALVLALWGVLVVGLVDNLVKPLLIRSGVELHGAVLFFSLIGGLAAFGASGLLIGPLAVALFVALLRIYRRDYGDNAATAPRDE